MMPASTKPVVYFLEFSRPCLCCRQLRRLRVHWLFPHLLQYAMTSWVRCIWEDYPGLLRESFLSSTQLTSAALCKSAQRGIILSPLMPSLWTKSTSITDSARRMLKTCTRPKNQQRPLCPQSKENHSLPSLPTPSHNSSLQKQCPLFHSLLSASSPGTRRTVLGELTPAKDPGSPRPSVAPRGGCVGSELRFNQLRWSTPLVRSECRTLPARYCATCYEEHNLCMNVFTVHFWRSDFHEVLLCSQLYCHAAEKLYLCSQPND